MTLNPHCSGGAGEGDPEHSGGPCYSSAPRGDAGDSSVTRRSKTPGTLEAQVLMMRAPETPQAEVNEGGLCCFSNKPEEAQGRETEKVCYSATY